MLGELFNQAPGVFYVFEPLDSVYVRLYGTQQAWNTPSDIYNYINGTKRTLPQIEIMEMAGILRDLFLCRVQHLPSEFLLHKYWYMFSAYQAQLKNYVACLKNSTHSNVNATLSACLEPMMTHCAVRFGHPDKSEICFRNLQFLRPRRQNDEGQSLEYPASELKVFIEYVKCVEKEREKLASFHCEGEMEYQCRKSPARVVKTVRANMEVVERLLQDIPSLKVLYLIRDPRGVVVSRHILGRAVQGAGSRGNLVQEARFLCNQLTEDLQKYEYLKTLYPHTFTKVIYEQFVQNPHKQTKEIFAFLNVTLHNSTIRWLKNVNPLARQRWKQQISVSEDMDISRICKEVYGTTDNKYWSLTHPSVVSVMNL